VTSDSSFFQLQRRGYHLGHACENHNKATLADSIDNWKQGKPTLFKGLCRAEINNFDEEITQSDALYAALLDGQECDALFTQSPYVERLEDNFESLGCSVNEGDQQEIETIIYDALDGDEVVAEDLWMKASWLSFHDEDASLRFRFSFGVDLVEDVAADVSRQHYASQLTNAIFPESKIITDNQALHSTLQSALNSNEFNFVERIVYFNAPNGGAYLHHDRERGHAGVVYAQLSGHTFWLALTKQTLMDEITRFVEQCESTSAPQIWPENLNDEFKAEIQRCTASTTILAEQLETFANSALIHLINETEAFVQHLIAQQHYRMLEPGDVLLLPQDQEMNCCWHSVFCLGEESGQALSFAIRSA